MQNRSATWAQLAADGEFKMEAVAVINGVEYDTITAPIITRNLLLGNTLSVGNCIAGSLKFTLMTTDTIPKSASILIKGRITDGTTYSEWLNFGTFWVSKRSAFQDLIDLECFDAMLKGNQAYSDNSQALIWPKTIATVVTRIAQQMGVNIDSRTTSKVINSNFGALEIVTKPNDDETCLDVLSYIAGVLGGNWTITPNNELRLVFLTDIPDETNYIVDEKYNRIQTEQSDYLIWKGESEQHEEQVHPDGGGLINVPVVIGSISTAKNYTISKVTLSFDSEHVYVYGNDSGYNLVVQNNPYASDALCQSLYSRVNGIEYAPFALTGAVYDPAVELGDWIVAGDEVRSVVFSQTIKLDIGFTSDVSTPGEDELEDEYPYLTPMKRMQYTVSVLEGDNTVNKSEIRQLQNQIVTKVTANDVESIIEQNANSIRLKADAISWESTYSSMSATGVLRLSASRYTDSMASVIDNDGLIIGKDGIAIIKNGNAEFSISNSYNVVADGYVKYDTQSDSDVVYVGDVDPIVQETEFSFGHETAIQPYYDIGSIEIRVKSRNLGIGGQNRDAIKITSNNTVYFAPGYGQVFVGEVLGNGSWYQVANYDLSYIFNMRQYYRVVNGLICKIDPIEDFE